MKLLEKDVWTPNPGHVRFIFRSKYINNHLRVKKQTMNWLRFKKKLWPLNLDMMRFDSANIFILYFLCKASLLVGGFMVFNATFNNISVISWHSVLLVEENGVPGENIMALSFIGGGNLSTRRKPPIYRKSLTKIAIIRTNYIFKIFGYRIQFIEFVKWYLSCIFSVTFKRKVIWYIQIWKHVDKVKNSYVFMLIFILSFCKLICKYSISRKSLANFIT